MLLVANLAITKWCKKPEKLLKPWQMGIHLRVLKESYHAYQLFMNILHTKPFRNVAGTFKEILGLSLDNSKNIFIFPCLFGKGKLNVKPVYPTDHLLYI